MPDEPARILITGANGHIGRQLIERLCSSDSEGEAYHVRALVRSERAAELVRDFDLESAPELVIGDYTDEGAMRSALAGCRFVVHLVGIIKEGGGARYTAAHEETCEVLERAAAAEGIERIVYLSIFGSSAESANTCLASKGRAEQILMKGAVPTTVLRVPMVLGPGDFATTALRGEALSRIVPLVGGGATMQQPIDVRDVVAAILAALEHPTREMLGIDIGGPERLTHRLLVQRAADLYGRHPIIVPIPLAAARSFAGISERFLGNPPITNAMLEVLQQDDRIDEAASCELLGIALTPLDETLRRLVGPESKTG